MRFRVNLKNKKPMKLGMTYLLVKWGDGVDFEMGGAGE